LALVGFKNDFFEIAKQIEIFTEMYKEINMNYVDETNPADLMNSAIDGMMEDLDPYTVYWTEQEVEKSRINQRGAYTGIGAVISTEDDRITVLEPWEDYPADKAGLKAGDEIVVVDGIRISNHQGNAGELLQGSPGTDLELVYRRQGTEYSTTLTRKAVDVQAVPYYNMVTEDIGFVVLSAFNKKASKETFQAVKALKEKGAKKIILDLRGNPGGLLQEAINVSNIFIAKDKLITSTQSAIEKYNKTYYTRGPAYDEEIPLVVLIDGRSASASEIVSGSIQDYDRGVIVGARSFGKGLVQRPKPLSYGTQIKMTISRYYTASGRCIQALDYRERDEDGNAIRRTKKDYKAFKTVNSQRTVYDGGGISPDISIASAEYSPITTALLKENAIFDFATEYYYTHSHENLEDFTFTDDDFEDFIKFLERRGLDFETETEKAFNSAFAKAEEEEFDDDILKNYEQLTSLIQNAKRQEIRDKKAEIMSLLTDELVKRYFYRDGLYKYQMLHAPEIKMAVEVLNDSERYQTILE
jgi:carboxyl-terminal processing protease